MEHCPAELINLRAGVLQLDLAAPVMPIELLVGALEVGLDLSVELVDLRAGELEVDLRSDIQPPIVTVVQSIDLTVQAMPVSLMAGVLETDLSAPPALIVNLRADEMEVELCWPNIHAELVTSDGDFVTSDGEQVFVVLDD